MKKNKNKSKVILKKEKSVSNIKKILFMIFIFIFFIVLIINQIKGLPPGISSQSQIYNIDENNLDFIYDLTYMKDGKRVIEQNIYNEVFQMIEDAENFIVLDMFLFNEDMPKEKLKNNTFVKTNLTMLLTEALINKKQEKPDIDIIFITDGMNDFYGSFEPNHYKLLNNNEIPIIPTDMNKLRDSNMIYSSIYRMFFIWFGVGEDGFIPHILGNQDHKITIRSLLKLLNFKANHRKLIITDSNQGLQSLVTSANPHTPSNLHSNVALKVKNSPVIIEILESEFSIVKFSSKNEEIIQKFEEIILSANKSINDFFYEKEKDLSPSTIQFLTEKQIKKSILKDIKNTSKGDEIELSMFYFSDRDILDELLKADKRGVKIRIILDPNVDAFGHEKNGIPNRVLANEMIEKSNISLRWYNTHGEQFHSKMIVIYKKNSNTTIIHLGSSNYTKRNLDDYNLEANFRAEIPTNSKINQQISEKFSRIWNNENDIEYTLGGEIYLDDSNFKYIRYRLEEFLGFGTY